MLIVYDSFTGNVKRFVDQLNMRCIKLTDNLTINEPYILVTYTFGFGQPPESTMKFLSNNYQYLRGVASSGNKNWGAYFGKASDIIADKYNVPSIMKFELSGTSKDREYFLQEVIKFDKRYA